MIDDWLIDWRVLQIHAMQLWVRFLCANVVQCMLKTSGWLHFSLSRFTERNQKLNAEVPTQTEVQLNSGLSMYWDDTFQLSSFAEPPHGVETLDLETEASARRKAQWNHFTFWLKSVVRPNFSSANWLSESLSQTVDSPFVAAVSVLYFSVVFVTAECCMLWLYVTAHDCRWYRNGGYKTAWHRHISTVRCHAWSMKLADFVCQ